MIRMYGVSMSYLASTYALRDVSLDVGKGEFVFLTGSSGAGKTTLLKLLFAAERSTEGQIIIRGRNIARMRGAAIPELRRHVGVVFQDFKLLNRRTVEENVSVALQVRGEAPRIVRAKAFQMLKQVGLQNRRHDYPLSLSGGEQQRVAIARALVNDPEILLSDEPTGNLDPDLTLEIMDLLVQASTRGTTVLVATHEHGLLSRYGKRVIHLEHGRIARDVPAHDVST